MTGFLAHIRFAALALAVAVLIGSAAPAIAQQPTTVNPTASSVKEDQLLNALQGGGNVSGRVTIPDKKEGVLIQPGGRDWQAFHQITLKWIGAISILGMLLLLVGFYLFRGMVRIERGRSGRTIVRFNAAERFVHWMTATCFIVLAISGLNITFGKSLLLPLMSPGAFTTWSQALKYAHNYLSFPFTFGVILMFLMWIGGNIPSKADVEWVKRGGGIFGDDHPPAPRFNAGQKMIYWIVVIGGSAVAITGYILMFPFYGTGIAGMQLAQIIHGIVALLFVAAMLAHIYIGTVGMEGAFEAMGTGEVDVNWAKEHHSLWLDQEMSGDRARGAAPRATPAE
ncbi:MAG TPA: formate dehydrogenase subunit gamma [Pseudorhodoplanes sp.]|nr:formate dehydrogenase subunit gamma [Pseudorhodoplanes sp.]